MAYIPIAEFPLFGPMGWLYRSGNDPGITSALYAGNANGTIDASAEKVGVAIRATKAGTISKVWYSIHTITQWPTNGIKISLQDLSSGMPDGTADQYRVETVEPSTGIWVQSGILSSDGTDTGTKRTVAVGDEFAVVIEFESFVASDSLIFGTQDSQISHQGIIPGRFGGRQYISSWAANVSPIHIFLEYSDGSYVKLDPNQNLALQATNTNYHIATTPDEYGVAFVTEIPVKTSGVYIFTSGTLRADSTIVLASDAGTIGTITPSTAFYDAHASNNLILLPFDSDIELAPGTTYYLTMKAGALTTNIDQWIYDSAVIRNASWLINENDSFYGISRTDEAASWTVSLTNVPCICPAVSYIDPVKTSALAAVQQFFAPVFNRRPRLFGGRKR